MSRPQLTVFVREGCGLCEEMVEALEPWRERYGFDLLLRDVDAQRELFDRYNELVPVLAAGDDEICHYFLDPAALERYFSTL